MDLETLRGVLGWCTIFGWAILLAWWAIVVVAGDRVHELHGKWFELSRSTFYTVHYAGMGLLKLLILMFNLFPYLALRMVA